MPVDVGAQVAFVGCSLEEVVESPALLLTPTVGVRIRLHHAARIDGPLTADGNDPLHVAVQRDRHWRLHEPCLVEDSFSGVEFRLEDGIRRYSELRETRADEIAAAISAENGSAGWFTKVGQPFLTRQVNAYLKAAEELGWEEVVQPSDPSVAFDTIVRREAIGVVAAVIPWNSPFSAATAKLTPALLAGNTVVLKVSPDDDEDDAVRVANDSDYGLSGGIWTSNAERALDIARKLRTGTITLNGSPISFDGPFGGYKASGIGREYGKVGLTGYVEHKTITRHR
ncbi:aldehyde dehydrogenase family protein [Streptomyces sp. NPDC005181]|uniref:aldehyde dehydrogenase family protein n=1 Tax=Streptomyces sp. NPDC005181 TaxID=3156869 RepID=UPI0033B300DF